MRGARWWRGLLLAACIGGVGCDTLGPAETLGRFEWAELEEPAAESSQFTVIGRDVLLLGDVNTDTNCFRLAPAFTESATTATLRIRAIETDREGCGARAATYRYEAFLRQLGGVTELRVIHDVEGDEARTYVHDLTVGS